MSIEVRQLNADSTFLLTFHPPTPEGVPAGSLKEDTFAILIDPWLVGESSILHPGFQKSQHTSTPVIASLADLEDDVDLILISQDKPDHCHKQTLCSWPKNKRVKILATNAAAKKTKSWQYFDNEDIKAMPAFDAKQTANTLHETFIPSPDASKPKGQLTIAHMPTRGDLTGLHNALGITYTPPGCPVLRESEASNRVLHCPSHTMTLLYTPHGVSTSCVQPWITNIAQPIPKHPPLTALFHSLTEETNLPFLGGKVVTGTTGGMNLMRTFEARHWISAHDEEKENSGWSVKWLTTKKYSPADVEAMLRAAKLPGKVLALGNGGREIISSGYGAHAARE